MVTTRPARHTNPTTRRRRGRRTGTAVVAALSLGLIGAMTSASALTPHMEKDSTTRTSVAAAERSGPDDSVVQGLETHEGSLNITKPGTVIDGLYVTGAINIRADDVTIKNTVVAYQGWHSIRVFSGADGARILDSSVYCLKSHTNGVVFGNYYAEGVQLFNCRHDFRSSTRLPAVVVDSFVDGEPYSTRDADVRPEPEPEATIEPDPTPDPTTDPSPDPSNPGGPGQPGDPSNPDPTPGPQPGPDPAPAPGGFPDASSTGVQSGVNLRPSGSIHVTQDGTVIDGRHVSGTITVSADNVTIRNTLIQGGGDRYPIRLTDGATNTLIEYVEVDNQGSTGIGIFIGSSASHTTVRYVDIHSAEDGIRIQGDNTTIEYSFVHDLARQSGGHHDSIQIRSGDNITIRGNNLQAYVASIDDPMNAAIQIGSLVGDDRISNLLVINNLMNGGNFTINGGGRDEVDSARYSGNKFGRDCRYGAAGNIQHSVWESSNVWLDNGEPVR